MIFRLGFVCICVDVEKEKQNICGIGEIRGSNLHDIQRQLCLPSERWGMKKDVKCSG